MQPPPESELQRQTLWLFGVLVGLAIKEAITGVYKHIETLEHFWGGSLEVIRLFIFLLLVVRFYLGSVQYFWNVYSSDKAAEDYPTKAFRLDFFFGFVHFVMLSVLGLSATNHGSGWWLFPALLVVVLCYDIPWYCASRNFSTKYAIRMWTVINAVTVAFSETLAFPLAVILILSGTPPPGELISAKELATCEMVAFVPVLLASIIDLGSLLKGESAIEKWLSESIHR